MIVRPVDPADAPALAAVHASGFQSPWSAEDLARFVADGVNFALAAESDSGMIAGFILCRVIAGEAEVLTLAVAPAHRRQGVAARLLAEAMARASLHAQTMFLEVAADNPGAISLYKGCGFATAGRRAGYYGRGHGGSVDALVMRRALNS